MTVALSRSSESNLDPQIPLQVSDPGLDVATGVALTATEPALAAWLVAVIALPVPAAVAVYLVVSMIIGGGR